MSSGENSFLENDIETDSNHSTADQYSDSDSENSSRNISANTMNSNLVSAENSENMQLWRLPLYANADILVGNAVLEVLNIYIENKLTKKSLDSILEAIHTLLPKPNNLPKNKNQLFSLLKNVLPKNVTVKHRICEDCSHYLGNWKSECNEFCENCFSKNIAGSFYHFDLGLVLKNLFEFKNLADLLIAHRANRCAAQNCICDITSGCVYREFEGKRIINDYDIFLLLNVDGTPLSNSSNSQIWLVQAQICNIPVQKRRNFQFVCGIFHSHAKKPSMISFMKPIVEC